MLKIEFETENDAFQDDNHRALVASLIIDIARDILDLRMDEGKIFDPNGNSIGKWSYERSA